MQNLNGLAKDLALEVDVQGEKLQKLDENMTVADKNAEEAVKNLKDARGH